MLCATLSGCKEEHKSTESPIVYTSFLQGKWQSTEVVAYCSSPLMSGTGIADNLIGKVYDFSMPREIKEDGGVVPIRNVETQGFFFEEFPYYLVDLELSGNYYPIIHLPQDEYAQHPCLIVKNEEEMLVTENNTAIYRIEKVELSEELQENAYDESQTFEQNIAIRMELQGIEYHSYYRGVWCGNWVIKDLIYADDMIEAEEHIGKVVSYVDNVDSFDIEFISSKQDRIFYGMPTTGELGLNGEFYVIVWDEDHEYPAAIVKSEHEMFLIRDNMIFRAVQEENYLDDVLLRGL